MQTELHNHGLILLRDEGYTMSRKELILEADKHLRVRAEEPNNEPEIPLWINYWKGTNEHFVTLFWSDTYYLDGYIDPDVEQEAARKGYISEQIRCEGEDETGDNPIRPHEQILEMIREFEEE